MKNFTVNIETINIGTGASGANAGGESYDSPEAFVEAMHRRLGETGGQNAAPQQNGVVDNGAPNRAGTNAVANSNVCGDAQPDTAAPQQAGGPGDQGATQSRMYPEGEYRVRVSWTKPDDRQGFSSTASGTADLAEQFVASMAQVALNRGVAQIAINVNTVGKWGGRMVEPNKANGAFWAILNGLA